MAAVQLEGSFVPVGFVVGFKAGRSSPEKCHHRDCKKDTPAALPHGSNSQLDVRRACWICAAL
eukprot:2946276-Rhodomonas_salina.1